MKTAKAGLWLAGMAGLTAQAHGAVRIGSFMPSKASPQPIGQLISWQATAADSNAGPLTFQFNVGPPGGSLALVKDFNVGTLHNKIWIAQPFVWTPTGIEGAYQIQVVIKDFTSGETASQTATFQVNPLVTGSTPVAAATVNPLVALFSAPSCPAGSGMRVKFQPQAGTSPAMTTNFAACHPPATMTFEIAGMYETTAYTMFSETATGGKITKGPAVSFTTGALPKSLTFPSFTVEVPPNSETDTAESVLLFSLSQFGGSTRYPDVATDLSGKVLWFYSAPPVLLVTRPLYGGTILTLQSGAAWNSASNVLQLLRQIDLIGNIIKETNTGVIQQQLVALGATDGGPCTGFPSPAPVGSACLGSFHHDAIRTLPNGYTAAIVDIEKIFPPGTQGDTSGLPVDIIGDMIVVLDANWQVVWYFDSFEHAGGAPQLDINRPAVLGDICTLNEEGCPPLFLLGPGIGTQAHDWLHANALYYWPQDNDIVWSSKDQDWVMKIDYQNGAGTGNVLWRMGVCGDFTFNNINNDPWPWFSAQHEVGIENNGAGPMTLFDNGDTRVSRPSGPGSSSGCMPGLGSGNSRGMALTVDESSLQVTPVLSVDLGVFSNAGGSAQLLPNGNYFFIPPVVLLNLNSEVSYSIEIYPTPGATTGTQVLNVQGPSGYRAWRMPNLYSPPLT